MQIRTKQIGNIVRFRLATPAEKLKRPELDDTTYEIHSAWQEVPDDIATYAMEHFSSQLETKAKKTK